MTIVSASADLRLWACFARYGDRLDVGVSLLVVFGEDRWRTDQCVDLSGGLAGFNVRS
jgi:hypothetical protein